MWRALFGSNYRQFAVLFDNNGISQMFQERTPYRGRRGPPYTLGHAEPFGSSRYESNLYIVKPPLDPVLIATPAYALPHSNHAL